MSNSGYRGRNFGPRGARTNGAPNGYSGSRFPHPTFNHLRPRHRLPGHEKWIEGPSFSPWQPNNNFLPHLQYRGNLQFRPHGRGRAAGGRGIVRFSGPGRPPATQFSIGYKRNPIPRAPLSQGELTEDKSTLTKDKSLLTTLEPQVPLLGSEEERQQKISETADKLKQKLSSITAEELTNFWEDDLSILSNHGLQEDNTRKKGIPELRHEPPELDLTFTDFRDIGRVDCNNPKFDNVDNKCNDEISVGFRQNSIDKYMSTDDEITIIDENKEVCLTALDSVHQLENFNPVNILMGDDKCAKQMHHKLSNFECDIENLQNHLPVENLIPSNLNNESSPSNVDDIANLALTESVHRDQIESVNLLTIEQSTDVNNIEATSALTLVTNDKDVLEVNFAQDENIVQIDAKDGNKDVTQDIPHDHYQEIEVLEDNQDAKSIERNVCQHTVYKTFPNIFESCQNGPRNFSHLNKELHLNTAYGTSTLCSTYSELHKLNDDQKFSKPVGFQPKLFNTSPRFAPRIGGTRGYWAYPQNGKNVFFRGSLRLPFRGNRISSSKHVASFQVGYDPRAPPSFSSTDVLPVFDPSEPPPNIRSTTEMSNRQDNIQTVSVSDSRSQTVNSPQNHHMKVVQTPPAFDPRGPPPRISNLSETINEKLPEFNPQQPPPKIQKREDTLQPPPIFDPRLTSQERSNLITPLDSSRSKLMPMNLVETSQITDYGPVAPNFSQLAPINMPPHQTFIPNVQMKFQPILSQTNSAHTIMRDFTLPPPPMNITDVPPPPPKEPLVEGNSNPNQSINMDDGLEDMQEAMEFAKQIMNMTEKISDESASMFPKVPLTPTHIPVPNEADPHSLCSKEEKVSIIKKQKKRENKSKRGKSTVVYEQKLIVGQQREIETVDVDKSIKKQSKINEDVLLSNEQIRPKVVFNLNSKTKKIHKPEEWHRPPINISENKDTFHQVVSHNINKTKIQSGKNSSENRSNLYQNKNKSKESNIKVSPPHNMSQVNGSAQEKLNEKTHHRDKCLETSYSHSSSKLICNDTNIHESQKVQKDIKKADVLTLETSWKNRVISRFLKMSKNDICNMVNNSSLRKFDIAMKHLVKERRTSLSLEMRNTEDEKMKEYDREEFMTQLNAMLDPSAIVAITDLPTEFIHHLSEVLQLDRMPFDTEHPNTSIDEIKTTSHNEILRINTSKYCNAENPRIQPSIEYEECQNISKENREIENKFAYNREELVPFSFTSELNLNDSRDDTSSTQRTLTNKINFDVESPYKKQQQPLFNEADLDDILSEVTQKTKNLPNTISLVEVEKNTEPCIGSSLKKPVITEVFERNIFSQVANKTAVDLDDIFSVGIAGVKLDKNNIDSDNSRLRKSSSEDRSIFRSERYERWNRKEQDDADKFRNLTKEEWEAKYGVTNSITISTVPRKSISNSAENLSRDNSSFDHRSNSPIRHVSLSPLTREASVYNSEKYNMNEVEELRTTERSESSSDFSSTSSSDSNEETVEPNVTKLLKVIKEKEKIAKKKSLNETIRDEVAAEIEKKWKEKSKYKDRKSRKRERRKKDKKDKWKKEKRKIRKQRSYSESSKSCEQLEVCPLLTENEIKKEVIVKEEPMSSFEDNIQFDNGTDNSYIVSTLISRVIDTQSESQNLQVGMEEIPAISCDIALTQSNNKEANVSMSIQPKTKAQLKQMPEANEADSEQIMEESSNIQKNNTIMNVPHKGVNNLLKVNTDTEIAKSIDEGIADILSASIFFNQSAIPLNIKESSSNVEPHIETTCIGSTMHPLLLTSKVSNLVTEFDSNNQCAEQKTYTSISATENKAGAYKKIDIKAYKERTLQRRLKEQAMLKENPINSKLFIQDLHSSPLNENNVESISIMNETLVIDIDNTKLQSKDPRLSKIKLTTADSLEVSNAEIRVKPLEDFEHQNVFQEDAESVASVQVGSKEKNITRVGEADINICIDSTKYIQLKTTDKSASQENIGACDFEASRLKEKANIKLDDKNSRKSVEIIDYSKFKNIRSEGGKELKLKKEKVKKSIEKKKKDFKPNESKSLVAEKHLDKYSYKVLESNQEPLNCITNITVQKETEEVDNSNNSRNVSELQTKSSIDRGIIQEQIDINFVVKQYNCNNVTGDVKLPDISEEGIHQVNEKIIEKKEIVDKSIITNVSNHKSQRLENKINDIQHININSSKITELSGKQSQPTSSETSNQQNNVDKPIMPMNSVSLDGTKKCEDTDFQVSNYVSNEETSPLSQHVTVDTEKRNYSTRIECLQNIMEHKNEEEHSAIKCIAHLKEFVKDSGNCNKVAHNEARSPDSPSSPFKGFLADSIEDKTSQVSQSYDIKLNSKSDKENLNYSKHWRETCFDNKLILRSTTGDKDSIKCNFKDRKEEKRTSLSNLMEVQKDVTERINERLDIINNVNVTGILDMKNNRRLTEEDGKSFNIISKSERSSFAVNIDSQDVYDEENEPFIVLDEYIDDTDGKSIEKLSALDLDLEECIARDADTFTNKSVQGEKNLSSNLKSSNLNTVDLKELSDVLDRNNVSTEQNEGSATNMDEKLKNMLSGRSNTIATDVVSSTSESNIESNTNLIHSIGSGGPIESSQNVISTTSKDSSQRSVMPELSSTVCKHNMDRIVECSNKTQGVSLGLENKIPLKLTNSEKYENEFALDLITNTEFSELNKPNNNKQHKVRVLKNSLIDGKSSPCLKIGILGDKDTPSDPISEKGIPRKRTKVTSNKSSRHENDNTLHKVKNRSKMKHKKQKCDIPTKVVKKVVNSDVGNIKCPSTKEAIMARMIEIDVEIHKLMTEKMTLYQMLTSGVLPTDNHLQNKRVMQKENTVETAIVRPGTPSALMSQLLQNIETSPVSNQCAKTAKEYTGTKDSSINSIELNQNKIDSKHYRHTENKGRYTSSCDSEGNEMSHQLDIARISKKKNRSKLEKIVKKSQNKLDSTMPGKDMQHTNTEKKRSDDFKKSESKKISHDNKIRRSTIELEFGQVSISDAQSQRYISKISEEEIRKENSLNNDTIEASKSQEVDGTHESTESRLLCVGIADIKSAALSEGNCLSKDTNEGFETSNKKSTNVNSSTRIVENRTPERLIYSDDSTWDSFLQTSSMDGQNKASTGLALLEETYRKEMAKTRRIKIEVRKKKKRFQRLEQTVNTLTPEEEELPLSALYIKKFYQRKKVKNSMNQQTKHEQNDDPKLWKNLDDVINAVAENRAGDLYVQTLEQASQAVIHNILARTPNLEENFKSKEDKGKLKINPTLQKREEDCNDIQVNIEVSCENKTETSNDFQIDCLQLSPNKSQEFTSNKDFQQGAGINLSSKFINGTLSISLSNKSANTEMNAVEFSKQQTVTCNNAGNNRQTSTVGNLDVCLKVSSPNSTQDNQKSLNIVKNAENAMTVAEEKEGREDTETNLQIPVATIEQTSLQESTDSQLVIISENVERCIVAQTKLNKDKDTTALSEFMSMEQTISNLQNVREDKAKDLSTAIEKDNNMSNTVVERNDVSQNEHFISLKEYKESQSRKETDRCSTTSSEESSNQNSTCCKPTIENADLLRNEELLGKKLHKRKRGSSRTPLRRSSRYTEEPTKRIKLEIDKSVHNLEQELQEKNTGTQLLSISPTSLSPCEEVDNLLVISRKSRGTQKIAGNRKRCTPMPPEIEIIAHERNANRGFIKGIKRYKQHTISEMMNCVVRLVDCRHTVLNLATSPALLQKYGISKINTYVCSNSTQIDSFTSPVQLTPIKDLMNVCTKQPTSVIEFFKTQDSKLLKKSDNTTQSVSEQINTTNIKKILKSTKIDSYVNNKEEYTEPDIELMPVLAEEPGIVDILQNSQKPDIEIVEEKNIIIKNQQHTNSGLTLTVIDTKDDKELPRTQYTVHKGPILDIKVFENSFLAASEDGRVYRYNQTSNGILNIYKGHTAAVTCLYVYNASSTDIDKEWMFSGSLDGTLQCYNIVTGIQMRDTADIGSPIQCMDEAWGTIFIGTKSGHVSRYHIKSGIIKGSSIQFSDKSVLALKATNEGPRRVLIVASRSQPITIRDAQNGLFLRTICGQKSHTVYSLMRHTNLIYCGTSSTSIPVFDFTNGEQTMQYDAGVGIVCMRLYKQLLFAGCYDGNIYVFNTQDHRLVCSVPGPGNMLLSMEVIGNKIIAGSKDKRLQSWQMPRQVRSLL